MKKLLTFSLLFFFCSPVFATHLKGGNIQVSSVVGKPLTYEFTVTLYCDNSAVGIRAWTEQQSVSICFGDGTTQNAPRINGVNARGEDLGNGIAKGIYRITYTYASLTAYYRVSVAIPNRGPNLNNLLSSEQYPFYIETSFNPNFANSTPVLTNDFGIIDAKAKQKFVYNSKALDTDRDSLAYRLIVVRSGNIDNCSQGGISISTFV